MCGVHVCVCDETQLLMINFTNQTRRVGHSDHTHTHYVHTHFGGAHCKQTSTSFAVDKTKRVVSVTSVCMIITSTWMDGWMDGKKGNKCN